MKMNNNYAIMSSFSKDEKYSNYIVFKLKEKQYAINIQNVIEVINLPKIEIPQATPKCVIGIFNYNGMMIKAVDLCPLLGFETTPFSINNQLIVVCVEGLYFTIHAEQIINITQIYKNNIQPLPYETENSIVKNIYKENENSINIIDVNKVESYLRNNNEQSLIDYSTLLPKDTKSLEILDIRSEQNKKNQELFAFPVNLESVNQYILFVLDNQNYYLDLKYIKEFISLKRLNITKLPYTEKFIKGIINLKGDFLVVVDLKKFLNSESKATNEGTKLIIVESKNFNIALLVDDIKFIKNLKDIKSTDIKTSNNSQYISEEFMEEGILYNILNFERIINDERLFINIK